MQPKPNKLIACLDITGSKRAWDMTCVSSSDYVVRHISFRGETRLSEVLRWVQEHRPQALAIDAPSGKNLGRTGNRELRTQRGWRKDKYLNYRLCEAELVSRNIQLYNTPTDSSLAQSWVKKGWELFGLLEQELEYVRLSQNGSITLAGDRPTLVEVHPHACFVVGLGWIPLNKETLSGQLERAAYLFASAVWGGRPLTGVPLPRSQLLAELSQQLKESSWQDILSTGIDLYNLPHDVLDSIAGLITLVRAFEGSAYVVGDPTEGMITLPAKPKDGYLNPARRPPRGTTPV